MIVNIQALQYACEELGIENEFLDKNQNFVKVKINPPIYFVNATVPCNGEEIERICVDKEFTYNLFSKYVPMPETKGFLDPFCPPEYSAYITAHTYEDIGMHALAAFGMPMILKSNFGTHGIHVFLANTESEVMKAVKEILNKDSEYYSYICLAQRYLKPKAEYRAVMLNGLISFAYIKDISGTGSFDNISPLHRPGAKALLVKDERLLQKLQEFIAPIAGFKELVYAGLDILEDIDGVFWLLEINTRLGFRYFVRDNGMEQVILLYKSILMYLMKS